MGMAPEREEDDPHPVKNGPVAAFLAAVAIVSFVLVPTVVLLEVITRLIG